VLGQTDPNRRYLIAATSSGMTDNIGTGAGNAVANATLGIPAANGTIFDRFTAAGISWADYNATFPTGTTMELYPANDTAFAKTNAPPISQFFSDARAGTLPQFSLLDPDYSTQSQENPQNIVVGEAFLGQVLDALRHSPQWQKTLLIVVYDEHGGYYDHVPRRRRHSHPTRSHPRSTPANRRTTALPDTASASPPSSSARMPSVTTSATSFMTTPRSSRSSSASGTSAR
jgi:phospholipase C